VPGQLRNHIIVCGLHDVGLRVVEQLHLAGERVIIVDDAPDPRLLRITEDWAVRHLVASPQREATLLTAGLATASALVCVDSDDLRNLETALLAQRLRPDLRVVVQLSNLAVGRAVTRVNDAARVLDVASLSAPSFVEACLSRQSHVLDVDGHEFHTRQVVVEEWGSLRSIFGDLTPLAVLPRGAADLEICPGRDLIVHPGDRVVLLSTAADFEGRRLPRPAPAPRQVRAARPGRFESAWRYLGGLVADTDPPLRLAVTLLLVLAVFSIGLLTIGYRTGLHHIGPLDAVYFTTETLTTVGFGDFSFGHESPWLRIWAVVLMILGASLVATVYALLTNLLVSRNLEQAMGRHLIRGLNGHIILVGLGSVGMRVLEELVAEGYEVVVLDRDENNRYLSGARALDVPVVIGDSTNAAALAEAGLGTASAVAVLTSSDLANIETGLAVDELLGERREAVPVVLRVFDRQLAHTVEAGFGFRHVRSTSSLAAPWFVGAALGLDVQATFYIEGEPLLLGHLTVAEGGGLEGRTMLELSARLRVIAIRRAESASRLEFPPRRDTRFAGGDQAYVIGPYEELLVVLRRNAPVI
jgi:Trk K+ transport system NAD-binding subunit